ncbi:glycoside hydrolase family 3 protein [Spirosoma sp. KUDC1026]|uniref:glycoside hydrolase family 3 protein n=1 Tax=Spirosoma sp. KUDC1026 TaxID=2745947 RepID=UPI00159BAFEA|nr:glycoside hydrolase family 3 N-terminal domain-containing protein [Spirosoma sp. KUDC1026]QKZ14890.1 glycoside hydrolase family 3 C-terminal domain-containing protein [Spirosoma sp. KUDC1026]
MIRTITLAVLISGCLSTVSWSQTGFPSGVKNGSILTFSSEGVPTMAYSTQSGLKILSIGGRAFKDLNRNGKLDPYEDWRQPVEVRAKDLASKMSIEQIAGLMLYSKHQPIPAAAGGPFAGTYGGKVFAQSGANPADLSDQQREFLTKDNLRHVLITSVQSPAIAAEWNNNAQALVEGMGLGIPINSSSDPRHGTRADAEYNAGAGGTISMWPGSVGLAATFDPAVAKQFGQIAAMEYRALGIATALSPQVDLATDPRWYRFSGTFGEDPRLTTDLTRAYIDGFQTSTGKKEIKDGWGYTSVNAMVKHWPGGGSGEAGRDAHYGYGKYAVYPGNNFDAHLLPFTEGAFKLNGKTSKAAAVMPYYTISFGQDKKNGENVGNSYNKYLINDLLRGQYKYDGVVCTDWNITADETAVDVFLTGKPWGVEKMTVGERHYKILLAGADQFGGNNDAGPVMEAYKLGVRDMGEAAMRARLEKSAVRLLQNMFRTGLFENPYLNPVESQRVVGQSEFMQAGYQAQLKSVVMLKNKGNVLPLAKGKKVYIPKRFTPAGRNFLGMETPEKLELPVSLAIAQKYFTVTDKPEEADFALAFIRSPDSGGGYSQEDAKAGGTGYVPVSLQYNDYTAQDSRDPSIAGGDPLEKFTNRTYKGKTAKTINSRDLDMVTETYAKMNGKPVITIIQLANPTVCREFEPQSRAILAHFSVQDQALLEILTGVSEPSALLPLVMPADMKAVEVQAEDVPRDVTPYVDSEKHRYDFGYGLNWKGVIQDKRTATYQKPALRK